MFKAPGSNHISNLVLSPVSCLPLVSILNTQYFYLYPCLGPVVIPITPRNAGLRNLITTGQNTPSALRSLPTSRFRVQGLRFKVSGSNHISNLVLSLVSCLSCLNTQYSILFTFTFKLYPCNEIPPPYTGFGMTAG